MALASRPRSWERQVWRRSERVFLFSWDWELWRLSRLLASLLHPLRNASLLVALVFTAVEAGQPEAWKESGGFAGTFSPNAAFVQTVIPVTGGQAYTARLVWKTNKADSGSIYAGAGPIGTASSAARTCSASASASE